MKINVMRRIDFWFGIPICYFLSIFHRLQAIIPLNAVSCRIKPKKLIFLEFSEIGSVILSYSAIKKIKETYPGIRIYFWIFKRNENIVHILNIMPKENVITIRDNNLLTLLIDTFIGLWKIRREKIDAVIDMELFSRFSAILSYLSGARARVGFDRLSMEGLYRGNLHTHNVAYNPYMHISNNFLALALALNSESPEIPLFRMPLNDYETTVPKIKSDKQAQENIWRKLKENYIQIDQSCRIVVLNPGVNEYLTLRKWPIQNYIGLAKKLLDDPGILVVLIGVNLQFSDKERVTREINNLRLIDMVGKTTIKELLDLYNISSLIISHDSGAANLASLSDIGIIVLFGPETPLLYAPISFNQKVLYAGFACSPCVTAYNHRRSLCRENTCMEAISVEEVYSCAKEFLNKLKK